MNVFFYLLTELDTPTEPPMPKIYNTDGYSGKKDDVKYFCYMFNLCDNYLFIFFIYFLDYDSDDRYAVSHNENDNPDEDYIDKSGGREGGDNRGKLFKRIYN